MSSTEVEIVRRSAMATLTDLRIAGATAGVGLVGGLLLSVSIVDAPVLALTLAAAVGVVVGHAADAGLDSTRASAFDAIARLRACFAADRRGAASNLLAGIAIGLVIVLVIQRPATSLGLFALGTAVLLTPVGPILINRTRAIETAVLGVTTACLIGAVVAPSGARIALLVLAAAGALVLRFAKPTTGAAALLLVVVATAGVMVQHPRAAGAADKTVEIDGDATTVATGVVIQAGQRLNITASGTVRFIRGDDTSEVESDGGPVYASGCDEFYFCGELLGRIGDGPLFRVGRLLTMVTTTAGELQLTINDFDPSDNSGSFEATITIEAAQVATAGDATSPTDPTASPADASTSSSPNHVPSGILAAIGAVLGVALGRGAAAVTTAQP